MYDHAFRWQTVGLGNRTDFYRNFAKHNDKGRVVQCPLCLLYKNNEVHILVQCVALSQARSSRLDGYNTSISMILFVSQGETSVSQCNNFSPTVPRSGAKPAKTGLYYPGQTANISSQRFFRVLGQNLFEASSSPYWVSSCFSFIVARYQRLSSSLVVNLCLFLIYSCWIIFCFCFSFINAIYPNSLGLLSSSVFNLFQFLIYSRLFFIIFFLLSLSFLDLVFCLRMFHRFILFYVIFIFLFYSTYLYLFLLVDLLLSLLCFLFFYLSFSFLCSLIHFHFLSRLFRHTPWLIS